MSLINHPFFSIHIPLAFNVELPFSINGQELIIKIENSLLGRGWKGQIVHEAHTRNFTITNSRNISEAMVEKIIQSVSEETNWRASVISDFRDRNQNIQFTMHYHEPDDIDLYVNCDC